MAAFAKDVSRFSSHGPVAVRREWPSVHSGSVGVVAVPGVVVVVVVVVVPGVELPPPQPARASAPASVTAGINSLYILIFMSSLFPC